jgi:uncharacterized membrane protein
MMRYGFGGGMGLIGSIFGGLIGLAILVLFVLLLILAFRAVIHGGKRGMMGHHMEDVDPLAIAKSRYAKGELSQAEYKRLVDDLKK